MSADAHLAIGESGVEEGGADAHLAIGESMVEGGVWCPHGRSTRPGARFSLRTPAVR